MNIILFFGGLGVAIGLSSILLLARKKKWCTNSVRFGITGTLFIIGLLGIFLIDNYSNDLASFLKWIQIPFFNSLIDRLFKFLSKKIQVEIFYFMLKAHLI
jgi:hypothetical protein